MTVAGKPSLVFPREMPRSPAEFLGILSQLAGMGFTAGDIATFESRLVRYLVTSPLRRAMELENVSAYDFFIGYDSEDQNQPVLLHASISTRCWAKCQRSSRLSTRAGGMRAPTSPPIYSCI